jgi:two-component system, cell cycle sensor histidine kinase and response regulator CckA
MKQTPKIPTPWLLITLLAVISLGIATIGYLQLEREKVSLIESHYDELSMIADLKSSQLSVWREERIADARTITGNPLIMHHLFYIFQNSSTDSEISQVREWFHVLHESFSYTNVYMVDRSGVPVLALFDPGEEIDAYAKDIIDSIAIHGSIHLTDIHTDVFGRIHMDLILPIYDRDLQLAGFVIAVIDPEEYLYPFLRSIPLPGKTGETLLFRQNGYTILFLSDVSTQSGTIMRQSFPLSDSNLVAVRGLQGQRNAINAIDYRGIPVYAAIREITGSTWFLIVKIDADEVLAPLRSQRLITAIQFGILLIALNLIVFFYVRYKQTEFNRRQMEAEAEHKLLKRHYDLLAKHANDIILLAEAGGRITEANNRAVSTYGYTRSELLTLNIRDLRAPEVGILEDEKPDRGSAEKGYLYETVHKHKNGKTFPVEISARLIRINGKEYTQEIIRDISERKRLEENLHRREEEFRALAENDPDIIARFDRTFGYVYTNPGISLITGKHRDYYTDKTLDDSELPDTLIALLKDSIRKVFESRQKVTDEFEISHNGSPVYIQALFTPEFDRDEKPVTVLMVGRDITHLKNVETRLRRVNRLYAVSNEVNQMIVRSSNREELLKNVCRIAVEYGDFVMAWIGLREDSSPYLIPYVYAGNENGYLTEVTFLKEGRNESQSRIYKQILAGRYYVCNDVANDPVMETHRMAALDRGYRSWAAFGFMENDRIGGWFVVYAGVEKYFDEEEIRLLEEMAVDIGYALDRIGERKARSLAEAQVKKLADIFSNTQMGIVILSNDGTSIELANDAFSQMLGYTGEELVGGPVGEIFAPEHRESLREKLETAFRTGHQVFDSINIRKDGSCFPVNVDVTAVKDDDGKVMYTVINVRDDTERLKAEEALRMSEERHRLLFESMTQGVMYLDAGGKIIAANKAVETILGVPVQEVTDQDAFHSLLKVIRRDGSPVPAAQFPGRVALLTGKLVRNQILGVINPKTDSVVWLDITAVPIQKPDEDKPEKVYITFDDVTDRIRAEEALEKTEALLYASIENLPDALGIFTILRDAEGAIEDIAIDYLNPAGYHMLQFSEYNLVGLKFSDFFGGMKQDELFIRFFEEIDSGKDVRWETVPIDLALNGKSVSLLIDLRAIKHRNGFVAIWREVSEKKKTEERLLLQGTALEAAANAIVITDTTGTIQWVNPAFVTLTGYDREEVIGQRTNLLKSDRHGHEFYYDMWSTISSGKVWQGELFNKRKDGTIYTEEMTITPVLDSLGKIIYYIAIKQDITKQKDLQQQIFQIQKLESIGTLASGIAHDFNNLLGIILGYTSVLHKARTDESRFIRSVDAISQAVTRGADLVQQILTFARKSDVKIQPVDVNAIIGELSKMLGETLPRTIELRTELASPLPFLMLDQNQLHQTLLNLCVNARDAILDSGAPDPGRGIIMIRTRTANGSTLKERFHEARSAQYIHISVSDTGVGIPEHMKPRIFDPFFSTKDSGKGSGLGLAVVYGVVNANGGFIDVESKPGLGSAFNLYLPVTESETTETEPSVTDIASIPGGTETILFVEDETLMLDVTRLVLEDKGYRVLVAHDGDEGIAVFNRHQDEISLLLTDLGLPKLNGFDMYRKIKQVKPSIKAILASGYLEPDARTFMRNEGILYIIGKPYEPTDILKLIHTILHEI